MGTPTLEGQAGRLKLVIEQGTTFQPVMAYTDAADAPIDLTGYTARMHIREELEDIATLEEMTTENSGGISQIVLGAALGTIQLLFADSETAAMTWESGVYDLELESPLGVVTRILEGPVVLIKEVTRQ